MYSSTRTLDIHQYEDARYMPAALCYEDARYEDASYMPALWNEDAICQRYFMRTLYASVML